MVPQGYVLGPREGEHLVLRGGDLFIKVDPIGGSHGLVMGTQQILLGTGIPIHRHLEMDEAFYVLEGSGVFVLIMSATLSKKVGRYSFRRMRGMALRTPTVNSFYSGLSPFWVGMFFPRSSYPTRRSSRTANEGRVE